MVQTKTLEETNKAWVSSHGRVPQAYSDGIARTKNWQAAAIAGEDLYAAKVQEAIASQRRAKKLQEVSDDSWRRASQDKGSKRIAAGMSASKEKFSTGMGKVLSVLQGVTLPPRTADGLANVDNRVKPIVSALMDMKK